LKKRNLLQAIDILVIIYCLINIAYIILGILLHGVASERMHEPLKHLSIFSGIIIFVLIISRIYYKFPNKFWRLLRDWYVLLFFLYFFEATSALNKIVFADFLDPFFQKIDYAIFGYQPAGDWEGMLGGYLINEIMHFAYFCYYFMGIFYLAVYLKSRELFRRYVFILTFVFFVCYLTFNLLPVVGGRFLTAMMEITQTYQYGPFTHIMAYIYNNSPHMGGAFPSSHVAIAITVNISAFKYNKTTGWLILPIVILLTIATVYCHYHYFIDTIFGVIFGISFYYLGNTLYRNRAALESHV